MEFSESLAKEHSRHIQQSNDNYRQVPITAGFDWETILGQLSAERPEEPFDDLYLVVFRSLRRAGANSAEITRLDTAAHVEALGSNALLHYFAGDVDDQGKALSWCLWTDSTAARDALGGEKHREAVRKAPEFYEKFGVELYDVKPQSNPPEFTAAQHPVRPAA